MQTHVAWDHSVSEALYKRGTRIPRPIWKFLEYTGDGLVWLAACCFALALPTTSRPARYLWANFLLGMLLDLIETGLVKALLRRPRPQYNLIAKDMNVIVAVDHFSFPSGHSSRVSFVALFLACVVLHKAQNEAHGLYLVATGMWAVIVAFSRCVMGRHYLSDVVAGLLLGVLTIAFVTQGEFSKEGLVLSEDLVDEIYGRLLSRTAGVWR